MRKYLIITVTAGEGHNSMAKALREKLEEDKNNVVKVIDIFKAYGKPGKVGFINDGYLNACKYALPLYNLVFRNMQLIDPLEKNNSIAQNWLEYETPLLINDIYSFKPDVIIGTHFYSGIIITNLKKRFVIPAKSVSLLTDYTVHPFHECATGIDYLITPTEILHPQLEFKGYKPSQLVPLGIPVRKEFSVEIDKTTARKMLGIDPKLFTVFISIGGGGFGGSDKILKKLLKIDTPIQIIVVNGKNKEAYKRINNIIENTETNHKIINYGFVNNIDVIMSASDCIVGKCGATVLNEALNKRKVLILNDKLAQQEYDNMMYLSSNNACIRVSKYFPVELIVEYLSKNPQILYKIEQYIDKIRRPNALTDIVNFVSGLNSDPYPESSTILTESEIKELRQELKKLNTLEAHSIKENVKLQKQLDKLFKDKAILKAEKKQSKENKDQLKQLMKQTKSTIYTDPEYASDHTSSLLGVEKLKN